MGRRAQTSSSKCCRAHLPEDGQHRVEGGGFPQISVDWALLFSFPLFSSLLSSPLFSSLLFSSLLFSSLLSSLLLPAGPCDSALGAGLASSQCVCPWRTQSPALMRRVIQMFRCSDPRNSHFPTFRSFISIEFPIFWMRRKCRTPKGLVLRSS